MFVIFLSIIAFLGAIYALFTKQLRAVLGLFIICISNILIIPDLTKGLLSQILGAIAMILFVIAVFVLVWKKSEKKESDQNTDQEAETTKES